ncbi:type II toxin-antitoxin system Phd/YefM family antitoxin [uncultured Agrococcus sp.]|uniref:type II toxin-antitoxin system Phd/YefM family antitoxin n=1 Tax=uncultured Agrococcus sp. TaxID=382258 RepID=UPI0025E717F4|nr:type II toxin-antitoxin system prevent-host-death family antitoxin [uncultured Agrococcus sp.]
MRTVSKRELNQNTAGVLDAVTDAEDVVVTERGRPRWRLSTTRESADTLQRFERDGRYTPPSSAPAPWPQQPGGPEYTEEEVDELLADLRGEH